MSYNTNIKYTNAYRRFRLPRDVYLDTFIGLKEDIQNQITTTHYDNDDNDNGTENALVNEVLENDGMTLIVEDYEKIKARDIIINKPENNVNNAQINACGNNGIIGIEELNQCLQNMELNDEKLGGDKINMNDILYDITSPGHAQSVSASIIDSTDHLMGNNYNISSNNLLNKNTNDIKKQKESNIINESNNILLQIIEKNDYDYDIKDNDAELEIKHVTPENNNNNNNMSFAIPNIKLVKKVKNENLEEKRNDYIKNIKSRKWKWIDENYYNKWKQDIDEKMNRLDYEHGILNINNNINKIESQKEKQNVIYNENLNNIKMLYDKSSKTSRAVENITVMNTVTVLYIVAAVVLFVTIVSNFIIEFYGEFNELQQYIDATWCFILPVLHMFIMENNNKKYYKNVNSIVELQINSIQTSAEPITDNQTVSNNMQVEI